MASFPYSSKRYSWLAWAVAGAPILAGFVQALATLSGSEVNRFPVLGAVASALHSVEVFRVASVTFVERSTLIIWLFVAITVTWLVLGAALWDRFDRLGDQSDFLRAGVAGFSGLLYFVLFFGVYGGLLTQGLPAIQVAGFFSTPFLVTMLTLGAVVLTPNAGPGVDLSEAHRNAEAAERTFRDGFHARVGESTFDELRDAVSEEYHADVRTAEEYATAFREKCREITEECERLQSAGGSVDAERAANLRSRSEALAPERQLTEIEDRLRTVVADYLDDEYGELTERSRYGQTYDLVNERHSIYLPSELDDALSGGTEIHIDNIRPRLTDAIRSGDLSAKQSLRAVKAVDEAIEGEDGLVSTVREREAEFAAVANDAEEIVDEVVDGFDRRFDPAVAAELRRTYVDGRGSVTGVPEIEDALVEGRRALHDCRFSTAIEHAERAERMAEELRQSVDEIWTVSGRIRDGRDRFRFPDTTSFEYGFFEPSLFDRLAPAFRDAHGASLDVDASNEEIRVSYGGVGPSGDGAQDGDGATGGRDDQSTLAVADAKHILGKVSEAAESDAASESTVKLNLGTVRDTFVTDAALETLRRFFDDQEELIESASVADGTNYVSVTAADGQHISVCTDSLIEAFRDWSESTVQ